MFVKKFVEKASRKAVEVVGGAAGGGGGGGGGSSIHGLKAEEVNPRLAFHYGIPSGSSLTAYHPIQHILALSTNDGRIKLFGMDGTQALLQSDTAVPSKFLQFIENCGILLNINIQNHIEVWDIDKKELCHVHISDEEITSCSVMQQSLYIYIGNSHGDIHIMKLEQQKLVYMPYNIPFSESHGKMSEIGDDRAVIGILPQPMSETKRVIILFKDGLISLWGIQESNVVYSSGGLTQLPSNHETKKAVAACWACPLGSKLVVGYSNGEILIWGLPTISDQQNASTSNKKDLNVTPNIPLFKLNLGYKTDKVPIVSLRWVVGDGKSSRLYVNGYSDLGSYSFQVIVLNEHSESRTIKLVLPLAEPCLAMELISTFSNHIKHKQSFLLLLAKSGQLYLYNDSQIEQYLLQCQSKSTPSLPDHFMLKLPVCESSITVAKLCTGPSVQLNTMEEEQFLLVKKCSNLFMVDKGERDATRLNSANFNGFTRTKSLYISGHQDGTVNFWDCSCPLLFPIFSLKHQSEESNASTNAPVTALYFDISSSVLVIGDQNGLARIVSFKKEPASENIFSFLQAKQGGSYSNHSLKVKGAIHSIGMNPESKHLAIGTDKGFVFMFETEGFTLLYQKQFPSQLYTGVFSLQFENCSHNGYAKNILLVGMQDSSILAIEEDTGSDLNATMVHTKNPSRALLMQILDGACISEPLILFCSDDAVRLYSLSHAIQGIKKVNNKKQFTGKCCFASIVYGASSDIGLFLVFADGKIEIRSLPNLSLLKSTSLRGYSYSTLKACSNATNAICGLPEGELIMVNGDQEIFFFSVFFQKGAYRNLEYINQVYKCELVAEQEESLNATNSHKEKKKGIFGMLTGNKSKHSQDADVEVSNENNMEELSAMFSTANFLVDSERKRSSGENGEDIELDIDDIDIEDSKEKTKERNFGLLNKQKLGKKLQAIKGKLKISMDEKSTSSKHIIEDDKGVGAVDQIKKKYGYAVNNESSTVRIAESKLHENVKKLQGINDRAAEMQDNAQSFSSLAKEVLRTAQKR